jgi:hypothetical protein
MFLMVALRQTVLSVPKMDCASEEGPPDGAYPSP